MNEQGTPKDYNAKFDQLSQMIADSNKLLERLATRPLDASKTRTESLTLNTNPVTFSSLGYSFYAIFAKSSFAMHVKQRGLTYDILLVPGFNQVYLLEMAELTADANQQITMMWSAYPFSADANANQTSTVAVSGTPSVTLTGSLPSGANLIGKAQIANSSGFAAQVSSSFTDGQTNAQNSLLVSNMPWSYNGVTWDLNRNNTQGTLLASAARTATTIAPVQTNYNARGVLIELDVTAASGTGGLQVLIRTTDPQNSDTYQLNATPGAQTTTGRYIFAFYPGIATTGGSVTQASSMALPRNWYVQVTHGDGTSYTYSLSYALIL